MALRDRANPHILSIRPYQPGKPVEELERELGIQGSVKLASNENPLGPSPKALQALASSLDEVNRYPDGACFALRSRLSEGLAVEPDQLVFGCGGDEVLELVAKSFLAPGRELLYAWPSFAMYPILAKGMGATPREIPLDGDLCHDLPAMAAAVTPDTVAVIVCNPNNPTGTSVGADALERFAEALPSDVLLVLDEAYCEYARRPDFPDSVGLVRRRPGTLVMRTFSKIYGLAGLRIGYAITDPEVADVLERARHPFNVNRLAELAALAALDDAPHVERAYRINAEGVELLTRELQKLGLEVWPTDANFVLVRAGEDVYDRLLREGVIVRPLGGFGMPEFIRITTGLPEENERAVKALARIRGAAP